MKNLNYIRSVCALSLSAALVLPALAQEKDAKKSESSGGAPGPEMMAAMMEMAKVGENHKLLEQSAGNWSCIVKFWMSPDAPPTESTGSVVRRPMMGGRYFVSDHTGKMQMPGPDGKMTDFEFKGMAIEGYDNAKKKFVSSWVDNMGTGIMMSEGDYDAAAKAFTFRAEYEAMPGMKMKIREVITIADKNHQTMEWYEDRGGKEVKTMEIKYTRK
ncbi:MAG: hypothetical protein C5B50_18775 [Verrucomicrobia bacterium]|nr:MAG: hypothetical protein C5B50_18775 [Verrucomicrobiota bacterium]